MRSEQNVQRHFEKQLFGKLFVQETTAVESIRLTSKLRSCKYNQVLPKPLVAFLEFSGEVFYGNTPTPI